MNLIYEIGQVGQREIIYSEILSAAATHPLMTSQRTRHISYELLWKSIFYDILQVFLIPPFTNQLLLDRILFTKQLLQRIIFNHSHISCHDPPADVRPSCSVWWPFGTRPSPGDATCKGTHGILRKNSRPPWVGMSCLPINQCWTLHVQVNGLLNWSGKIIFGLSHCYKHWTLITSQRVA